MNVVRHVLKHVTSLLLCVFNYVNHDVNAHLTNQYYTMAYAYHTVNVHSRKGQPFVLLIAVVIMMVAIIANVRLMDQWRAQKDIVLNIQSHIAHHAITTYNGLRVDHHVH